jgi:hypothetical protein
VVLEYSVRLLADEALACKAASRPLDLACFDCTACHHELRAPDWRGQRAPTGTLGRPPAPRWPSALLGAAIGHADGYDEQRVADSLKQYEALVEPLHAALEKKPFGQADEVATAAAKLANWAAELADKAGKAPMNQSAALRFARSICKLAEDDAVDYDSARQIAWAIQGVVSDLTPKLPQDGAVRNQLASLDHQLLLALPRGRQPAIIDGLGTALKVRSNYDSDKFRSALRKLSELLND